MRYITIIICVVLVAGLVIGFSSEQVWEYLFGVFRQFGTWIMSLFNELVFTIRSTLQNGGEVAGSIL